MRAVRRVVWLNLMGALYGSYADLAIYMRGGRGPIINAISIGPWASARYAAA